MGADTNTSACMAPESTPLAAPLDAPQFALLDYLVPGFSVFSRAIHAYMGIDLNLYIPLLLVIFGTIFAWNYLSGYIWGTVEKYLMSSVKIRTDDEIYNMMMVWIARQNFSQRSRRFIANTNINSRSWFLWSWRDDDDEDQDDDDSQKKSLRYTPSFGTHYFWYRRHLLVFERQDNREQGGFLSASEREELSISCFGRNPYVIKELLLEAREEYLKKDVKKTLIYRGASGTLDSGPSWQRCMARTSRPFPTVILNEKTKKELIDDVTDYLDPATRRWYSNRGIPYRRGYLLHGPPGTGKSSLSLALAGFFQLRIYIVSLSSIVASEENLSSLFADLPRKCVVLLEDIDSAGLTHTREAEDTDVEHSEPVDDLPPRRSRGKKSPSPDNAPVNRLSLSGLLNILDGVASQEGRVLIMTTNHIEKLDKALIRPGRVDMVVKFGLADAEMSASIFRAIYVPFEDEGKPNDGSHSSKASLDPVADAEKIAKKKAQEREETIKRVDAFAKSFAAKIPEHEFSPAEIQGLLLRHKHTPEAALEEVDEWIVQTRKEKKQKEVDDAEKRRKEEEERKKAEEKKKRRKEKQRNTRKKSKKPVDSTDTASVSAGEEKPSSRNSKKSKSSKKAPNESDESAIETASSSGSGSDSGSEEDCAKPKDKGKLSTKESHDTKSEGTAIAAPEKASNDGEKDGQKKTPSDSGYEE